MASAIPSLLFCLLVLAPHLGSSSHTSFINGGKQTFVRSSDSRTPPTCSPAPSGDGGEVPAGRLPVVHRLSPCSPSGAGEGQSMLSAGDAFDRDSLRLRALFGESDTEDSKAGLTIPATGAPLAALPGAADYSVVVGFGNPVQKLAVGFDTATVGATLLQCKPCSADGDPCDRSFDPSRSHSLAQIPCASPDCPLRACNGPRSCTVALKKKGAVLLNATVVTDTLTFSRSVHADQFRFACLEMGATADTTTDRSSGVLDLSRERHSLASRVLVCPNTVAFSYCLPADPGFPGFLSLGPTRPERSGRGVVGGYATVWDKTSHPNLYFLRLVGVSVGVRHLPVPPAALASDALLEVHTTFNYLSHHVYAALRHEFREQMREYRRAPPMGELETCYDFSRESSYSVPMITLRFHGGAELVIDHMLYFKDPRNVFGVACLAFAPAPAYAPTGVAVVGSMAQANMEVVYDVRGGRVGFVPNGC
ncbi:aspartyl protease 25-like [Triticum dicoccoides]|uniref:aspartyl protease 25-like n=1 Tax=Triticum dicoccoides TaxID=85692 RepID=UPI0018916FA8|nr:aspartyl protease 25-like [Triticum dicoccoides]